MAKKFFPDALSESARLLDFERNRCFTQAALKFSLLNILLASFTFVSLALTFWRWIVARKFPLHQRIAENDFQPPVTLLKPLKGADPETRRCLQSWFTQNYSGPMQILFGVASAKDPVCEVVRALLAEFPKIDAQLFICEKRLGANRKISTLTQLEPHIRHDVIIISDADVEVPPDFLANVVAPLRDEKVGLVNCFYRLAHPTTLAMRWEAIATNADFWSEVLQAKSLKKVDFALGAVMATTRAQLKLLGGFSALLDYLADDYQLGNQIFRRGGQIVFCPIVADCREKPMNWKKVFLHQLRWARTIRVCQPAPFFLSIISNATLWPLLWWVAEPNFALIPFAICLLFRILSALDNQCRLSRSTSHFIFFWLVPIKDLLNVVIWALAFLGNQIEWRGEKYKILPGGKLLKISK